jgi:O-antigen ligase
MALIALAFLMAPPRSAELLRQPVVASALGFGTFLVLHTAVAALRDPASAQALWNAAADWLALLVFIPFGYFLAEDSRRLGRLLALSLTGLIAGMLWRLDWGLLLASREAFLASRPGFGFPAIAFALYSGSGILGLVFLARRFRPAGTEAPCGAIKALGWTFGLALLAAGFVGTQSRGSWIALMAALVFGFLLAYRVGPKVPQERAARQTGPAPLAALLAAVLAVGLLLAYNGERMLTRTAVELDAIGAAWQADIPDRPRLSLELRLRAQLFGLDRWMERPWLGWGAGSSHRLMEASGNPGLRELGSALRHLHNTYLEVLVQFGTVGAALLGAVVVFLVRGLWRPLREGRCPADLGVFLLTTIAFVLVWSLWSYRVVHQDWRIYWVLLAGTTLSLGLGPQLTPQGAGASTGGRRS